MRKPILNTALAIGAGLIAGSASVMAADKAPTPQVAINTVAIATIGNGSAVWVADGYSVKKCSEVAPNERMLPTIPEVRCIFAH